MSIQGPSTSLVRGVEGQPLPVGGRWVLDPGHTSVEFTSRHVLLTKVGGRITGVTGTVVIGQALVPSSVEVTLDMSSVVSGSRDRDDHLRSTDFFAVGAHPTAEFRSTYVDRLGRSAKVTGELTIVGVTRPVVLDVEFLGTTTDRSGGTRAVFSASTEIDREAWGLTWNQALEGGLLVSRKIRIEIETEMILQE